MSHFSVNTAMVRIKSSSAYKSQDISDFEIDRDISFSFLYHTKWCSWLRSNSLVSGNLATHPCWDKKRKRARRTTLHMGSLEGGVLLCKPGHASEEYGEQVCRGQDPCSRNLVSAGLRQHWGIPHSPRRRYPTGLGSHGSSNVCVAPMDISLASPQWQSHTLNWKHQEDTG